ncbi:hypothetical protein TNCV_3662471 [Trichonephila clavipes]|nr:hypothetical protein TNCV_3662471 [Trichonephila clavipes]
MLEKTSGEVQGPPRTVDPLKKNSESLLKTQAQQEKCHLKQQLESNSPRRPTFDGGAQTGPYCWAPNP